MEEKIKTKIWINKKNTIFVNLIYLYNMKIIDNRERKDYYDYLTGIYGVDPKLVLDRRKHVNVELFGPQRIILYICGYKYEGFYNGHSFYYGLDLDIIGERKKKRSFNSYWNRNAPKEIIEIKYKHSKFLPTETINVNPEVVKSDVNDKENCPIVYGQFNRNRDTAVGNYPKLSDLSFGSVIPPEEIYQMLVQWLSERITKNENIVDTRTDTLRLESKGFDKKISFRKM